MISQKFKACMWKNYRARMKSKILTFLEIILPVILFLLLVYIHTMDAKSVLEDKRPEYKGEAYNMSRLVHEGFSKKENIDILFSPNNIFTVTLMKSLSAQLFENNNITHKIRTFEARTKDVDIASWLASKYYKENNSANAKAIGFGFLFPNEEKGQEEWTGTSLEYKIMCSTHAIKTSSIFPDYIGKGRGSEGEAYINSGIAVVQWHIEKAFIEFLIGENLPFQMELHSFPYPHAAEYQSNEQFFTTVLLPLFTMISFIFFIPVVIRRIVQEKMTGELMRIMGLNDLFMWTSWLVHSIVVFLLTTALVTVILGISFTSESAFLDCVDLSILWLLFFLFCVASLIFCFTVATFFNNPVGAMSCGVILWIGTFTILNPLIKATNTPWYLRLAVCVFPTAAITTGFSIIGYYDNRRERLTWGKIFDECPSSTIDLNMASVLLVLIADIALFMVVTWYFDSVKPGPFGIAKPWNFIWQGLKRQKLPPQSPKREEKATYEEPLPYLKVGICVNELRKLYKGDVVGLDGVTMNIYQNVITVFLGHNGAGKTSLMGIISGLHSPSSGTVFVGGEDIFSNMKKFHKNLGICFQYNYLFTYLNVLEHLIFFGMVRGMSFKKAKKQGLELLKELNLMNHIHSSIQILSGGLLRRVSLAIAMIGNPKVLMLDEPTSGMDPETRREVWELILRKRGSHTILITTQFMEEADVLGDWIAIMDHGKVVCYGTTPFLKNIYGTGYHLSVTKDKKYDSEKITEIVKKHVPQCTFQNVSPSQVIYSLPLEATATFPAMFSNLEERKHELGIASIGVQCTTIEDVFLKVGEMLQGENSLSFTGYLIEKMPIIVGLKDNLTGRSLIFQQLKALLLKKLIFDFRNLLLLIILTAIPVVVVLVSVPQSVNLTKAKAHPPMKIMLKSYKNTTVFSSISHEVEDNFKALQDSYQSVVEKQGGGVVWTKRVTEALLEFGTNHSLEFRLHTIVSAAFKKSKIQAFFNNIPIHAIPITINLVSNALLNYYFPKSELTLTYIPVDLSVAEDTCAHASLHMGDSLGHQWAISIPQCLLCIMTIFILLPAVERSTSCKHLQLMTGVTPLLYWLTCFLWDFFLYVLVTILIVITITVSDTHHIFTSPQDIGTLVLILLLYGASGTAYAYFFSNFGSSTSKIVGNFLVFSISFGMITAIFMNVAVRAEYKGEGIVPTILLQILKYSLPLCPHYCLVTAIILYGGGVFQSKLCRQCLEHFCEEESLLVFNSAENQYGFLLELIYLSLEWILYLILLLLADNNFFSNLCWKFKDCRMDTSTFYDNDDESTKNSDVRREREKTLACIKDRYVDPKAVFLCAGLGKMFNNKKSTALQPMFFRVRKGECFGLLGTNGAGKSTTFKLLVGELRPTVGDAVNYNYTLKRNRRQYLKKIGFCPQMGAVNFSFTGEETLRLFAQLRGVNPRRIETEVDNWIRLLGLHEYRSFLCGTYSSGTLRKLSTAVALIGHPAVVFLDEPTAGVDPFGRRNLWEVLNASKELGQAILLTSHSMQECEALCARLTIIVNGRIVCLGNTQYLKKKFGQGYTLAFVLHTTTDLQETLPKLKSEVYKNFNKVKLKDEHKKLLHFHVKDENIKLSQLFSVMEELKQAHPVIQSYMLGDTTLEQVFISFAKSHIQPEIIL